MAWDKKCAICGADIPHRPTEELSENGFNMVKIGNYDECWYCPKHSTQDMLTHLREIGRLPEKAFVKSSDLWKKE